MANDRERNRVSAPVRFGQLVAFWERFIAAKHAFYAIGGRTLEHAMKEQFREQGHTILATIDRLLARMLPGHSVFFKPGKQESHAILCDGQKYPVIGKKFPEALLPKIGNHNVE